MNSILEARPTSSRSTSGDLHRSLCEQIRGCNSFPAVIQVPCSLPPFRWLAAQTQPFQLFWGDRATGHAVAGLGVAERICGTGEPAGTLIDRCRQTLALLPDEKFFGGFAFQSLASPEAAWSPFGPASFWLPRATLSRETLRIVVLNEDDVVNVRSFIDSLNWSETVAVERDRLAWINRSDLPNRSQWNRCIDRSLQLFADEVLEKLVLARRVDLTMAGVVSPMSLLERLAENAPSCFQFAFQLSPQHAFLGATPERLFSRQGRHLESEVVAGTRPRGATTADDAKLGDALLASAKDQLEHDIVRKCIRQRLHGLVENLYVDHRATLLKLANKQHLRSRVSGELSANVSDAELIERLHPTPAVGGYPTEIALSEIARLEQFDRGWYAAPVGWIGRDEAEFAVAIRSGLIHGQTLSLYSGAGIVPNSNADDEWQEIEHKISDFLLLLTDASSASLK